MNAKFSVGEVVILQSVHYPEENGETTVINMRFQENPLNASTLEAMDSGWVYTIEGKTGEWHECAIRKKQQPGTLTYDQLMQSLRSPIYEVS